MGVKSPLRLPRACCGSSVPYAIECCQKEYWFSGIVGAFVDFSKRVAALSRSNCLQHTEAVMVSLSGNNSNRLISWIFHRMEDITFHWWKSTSVCVGAGSLVYPGRTTTICIQYWYTGLWTEVLAKLWTKAIVRPEHEIYRIITLYEHCEFL